MEDSFALAVFFLVLLSIVWVAIDVSQWQSKNAVEKGEGSPALWLLACLIMWIFFFPVYVLVYRPRFARRAAAGPAQTTDSSSVRFPCPVCGESIPTAAHECRFCHAVITDTDRPAVTPWTSPAGRSKAPTRARPAHR